MLRKELLHGKRSFANLWAKFSVGRIEVKMLMTCAAQPKRATQAFNSCKFPPDKNDQSTYELLIEDDQRRSQKQAPKCSSYR